MRIVSYHSHLNGWEWLQVHKKGLWDELEQVIRSIDAADHRVKESKEARMLGRLLYSPGSLNKAFKGCLEPLGWEESRRSFWVTDDFNLVQSTYRLPPDEQKSKFQEKGKKPISTFNQTDFVKERVAVEVQFGKYPFIAYDLFVKHGFFYSTNEIDVGIEVVPMKSMQSEMSSGPGYYEKSLSDLAQQGRAVPPVPLVLVGIDS